MAMEGAAPLHHYLLAWHTWHMAHIKPHLFEEGDMLVLCALHPTPIFKKKHNTATHIDSWEPQQFQLNPRCASD